MVFSETFLDPVTPDWAVRLEYHSIYQQDCISDSVKSRRVCFLVNNVDRDAEVISSAFFDVTITENVEAVTGHISKSTDDV